MLAEDSPQRGLRELACRRVVVVDLNDRTRGVHDAKASIFVTQYVNLEACERSALGGAVARYMSHSLELIRLLGMAIMAIGAWFHSLAAIFLGLTVIILIWMRVVLRAG